MDYKRCFAAMVVVTIVGCSVLGIVFVKRDNLKTDFDLSAKYNSSVGEEQFVAERQEDNQVSEIGIMDEPEQEMEPITTETPIDMQIATSSDKTMQSDCFAEITIKTYQKTGTYTVRPDVNEKTLKENIGWLPSSSLPGEDGLCVLMGHRDTDFRILKYIEVGDEIIVDNGVASCVYTVSKVEIVNSDSELKFAIISGSNLVLVTCYPFLYEGHAPKKFVIYSKINE